VVEFEQAFIEGNGLEAPNIDYFKLKRFLETAVRNLRSIDANILTGLVHKLYKDVMGLYTFYSSASSKVAMPALVFERDFLKTLKPYNDLVFKIEELKSMRNSYEMKMRYLEGSMKALELNLNTEEKKKEYAQLKSRYAEAAHFFAEARDGIPVAYEKLEGIENTFRDIFIAWFEEYKEYYISELRLCTNTKFYYLDKLLWYKAERSNEIRRFFKDAGIRGNYDTKTFIEYYLRNIDLKKTFDRGWHTYLREILATLE
ncbi:MAG TPA: hypothetical protein PKW30_00145, partial [Campylobacterales bacterium]|nr:hypothetical protein [Campylobacterales bacterium]